MDKPQRRITRRIALAAVTLAGLVHPQVVTAAPAGTPHYPDLVSSIPLTDFGIVQTSPTTREFRYTHIISNLGEGPLELHPNYDATTDTATAVQRIYTHNASGTWSTALEVPVVGRMIYHPPHGHYHFPLAEFGLYAINADGSRGAPVSVSPKVGFCIADSLPTNASLPHYGAFRYDGGAQGGSCNDPTSTLGIGVGMGDLYDFRDDGQAIDASSVADGEYWFHSVADPWNYLRESNESNNITDVRVRITGSSVTVLSTATPSSAPPSVSLTAPAAGASVSGITAVTASVDPAQAIGVQFILDGNQLGLPDTLAPYSLDWDTATIANGTHLLAAQVVDALGRRNTTAPVQVQVSNSPPAGTLGIDALTSVDGRGTVQTAPFTCTLPGETLLALVSSDGPDSGQQQQSTVTGAGLTWSLVRRANTQAGTSEIWSADAPSALTNVQVTATPRFAGYDQSLTVVSLVGSGGLGAKVAAGAPSGAPIANLTTTVAGSMVFAVGNDWDRAVRRTLVDGQTMLHQWVDTGVGDTFWTQRTDPLNVGTIGIGASAPTDDQWNLAAVEVIPTTGSPPPPTGVQISGVLATNRTATSVQIQWTTDVPSDSLVDFGTSTVYDRSASSEALVTSHALDLTGLSPATTYHYRLRSVAADGRSGQSGDLVFTTASVSTITCSITAPAPGATVSGTVQVSVDASSTASVTGVQLRLDGAPLGAEDTGLPYVVPWDTSAAAVGAHSLTAVVRDPTGNTGQCAPVNVTVERAGPPPATGPVAAWSFNAGSGTSVADTTGRGHTGTLVSGTWTTAGRYGGAVTFNGTSTRVNIADAADLRLTTSATVEAWVRPTSTLGTSWRTVVLRERTGGLSYALYANGSNRRPSGYLNTGGSDDAANGTTQLALSTWTHLAMTYDGTAIRLYLNGSLVGTKAHTGPMASAAGALRIGGNAVWGEYFAGQIDEVRIYDRVLTAAQITTDMSTAL